MSNVFFIGDLHLKNVSPISRCDDYPNAILNKIEYLASIAKSYKCRTFIMLGDIFDSPVTTLPYLSNVINTFKKVKEYGIKVYTIVGNHDIKNNRMDSLQGTALGILLSTGYVELAPNRLVIENTVFKCYNYPEEIEPKNTHDAYHVNVELYEVCVAHLYYEFNLANDSLHKEDLERLNYDAMILGHYHAPCDTELIGNTVLYRPGSLSRNTSEPYNKVRTPRVLVFNTVKHKACYIDVQCKSCSDIFVSQIESNDKVNLSMKDLINYITTSYNTSDMNVRDYFNQLNIPFECKSVICKYLDSIGV